MKTRNSAKILSGSLWWILSDAKGGMEEKLRREVIDQKNAGFDLLWLVSTTHVLKAIREKRIEDPYPTVFREADRLGMRVLLETHTSSNWWVNVDWKGEADKNDRLIAESLERYGSHSSFWGWYIGYETHHAVGDFAKGYRDLLTHIRKRCKKESPEKATMLSPFFLLDREELLGFDWIPPDEFTRFWTEILTESGIDIYALQDSGEHLACYPVEARRPFLEAGKKACDKAGARFWGNVETGEVNIESVEAYSKIKDQVDLGGTGKIWQLVPMEKLKKKVALAEEFSEELVTWGYTEYWRPSRGEKARAYYDEYRAWMLERAGS